MEPMEPRIETRPAIKLVGVAFNPEQHGWHLVPSLWYRLCWEVPAIPNHARPGVSFGYAYAQDCPTPGIDTYLAGIEVTCFDDVPERLAKVTVPAGQYAAFTVKGGLGAIPEAYGFINETWLPQSGFREARCGAVEVYDERFVPSGLSEFEIRVAVERV
jgi:AraC family transcriptional regulator